MNSSTLNSKFIYNIQIQLCLFYFLKFKKKKKRRDRNGDGSCVFDPYSSSWNPLSPAVCAHRRTKLNQPTHNCTIFIKEILLHIYSFHMVKTL